MIVTILDYGTGNLHSLSKAIVAAGVTIRVESDIRRALATDALVLPGVGSFARAASGIAGSRTILRERLAGGLPCLAICLGMQLLFVESDEGPGEGIGLIDGRVTRLSARSVPQMGWNSLDDVGDPLLIGSGLSRAYYANSFAARPTSADVVIAWSEHQGDRFPAAVRMHRTVGVQFHPEKSSRPGLAFIRSFLDSSH
ncbi:MAG: imidazole glycerol phosphate synthase subunit HisH [Gemmatimonadota bacterium]